MPGHICNTSDEYFMEKPLGNCFENSFHYMFSPKTGSPDMVLVHGMVSGQDGMRFEHAWVENGDIAIDTTLDLNNPNFFHKSLYYAQGKINPQTIKRYTRIEAFVMASKYMHYGNWEDLGE